jgi:hypothetical protein
MIGAGRLTESFEEAVTPMLDRSEMRSSNPMWPMARSTPFAAALAIRTPAVGST